MNSKAVIPEIILEEYSQFLSDHFALNFPKEKYRDLERGINDIMPFLNETDPSHCIQNLKSKPLTHHQIEILTSHFTVGETYFFREPGSFKALQQHLLPKLIEERKSTGRMIRIWSAACSSGEEPYSIAILISELIKDLHHWNVTILATDINIAALKKLKQGIYTEWSFRGVSQDIKEKYFTKTSHNRYEILPSLKKMVTGSYLNLAEDTYPSLINNTNAMDIIFCRNLLMYFVPNFALSVVERLKNALIEGGTFVVSGSDLSLIPHHLFSEARVLDAIFFIKGPAAESPVFNEYNAAQKQYSNTSHNEINEIDEIYETEEIAPDTISNTILPPEKMHVFDPHHPSLKELENSPLSSEDFLSALPSEINDSQFDLEHNLIAKLNETGRSKTTGKAQSPEQSIDIKDATVVLLRAEKLANFGKLDESLELIEKGLLKNKCNPKLHYLKALVLQELGSEEEAIRSLNKVIYLDPNFILAYFSLGNIASIQQKWQIAKKYYSIVFDLTHQYLPEDEIPGSEGGITAERMREIIRSKNLIL